MTERRITLSTPIRDSARVAKIVGAIDKPNLRVVETVLQFEEPPSLDEKWRLGLIVGASGSGKTSVARALYPGAFYEPVPWDPDRAVVDAFEPRPFRELETALVAVGFATRTSWLRPYRTLSGGERFRCDLCKALLDSLGEIVVFDEFASLVDATIAKTASIAVRKALDRGTFPKRLVALAHRRDVVEPLEPDWLLDADSGKLTRGRLRRPRIELDVREANRALWPKFAPHHYLSGALNPAARSFVATLGDRPVAFAAILQSEGRRGRKRVHRLVVAPEFQGIGIGGALLDALAEIVADEGSKLEIVVGAGPLVARLTRAPNWRLVKASPVGRAQRHKGESAKGSFGRAIVSFIYLGNNAKST
ncbi:MAG: GNAT family N-acetyltransferase [Thermoguttaceae bacterium]|nr:GNAT family N-acetyltransferase [Thermoguttaceae bacterium]